MVYCLRLSRVTWLDRVWFIEQFVLFRLFPNYQNYAGVAKKYLSIIAHNMACNLTYSQKMPAHYFSMLISHDGHDLSCYPHTQDRGNTPLHVAAQAGQAMQVELLVANGAHPSTLDKLGHTPEECARYDAHFKTENTCVNLSSV